MNQMSEKKRLCQYCNINSAIEKLDVRTKMFCLGVCIILVVLADTYLSISAVLTVLIISLILSKIPLKRFFRGIKTIIIVTVAVEFIEILFSGGHIKKSVFLILKMTQILMFSNLFMLTSKPMDIADGLAKTFHFLNIFGINAENISSLISISLRFIPILSQEADNLVNAAKSRGANFTKTDILKKIKLYSKMLVVLFDSAFKRADSLALAMDSRLYGIGKRTRLRPLVFKKNDYLTMILFALLLIIFITGRIK